MIKDLSIHVFAAFLFLYPFFEVAADSAQTSTPESLVLVGVRSQLGAGLSSYSGIAEAQETVSAALAFGRSAEFSIREQSRSDLALLNSFEIRLPALQEATRTAIEVYESYNR